MAKENFSFDEFIQDVNPELRDFVERLHEYMTERGVGVKVEMAKSGYVLSYLVGPKKKTLMNFVFRKDGMLIRIYAENHRSYLEEIKGLPDDIKAVLKDSPNCKRLHDPSKCSSKCSMGYTYELDGEEQKKCRFSGLMFAVNENSAPYAEKLVKMELGARTSGVSA